MRKRDRSIPARLTKILKWFGLILLIPAALFILLLIINAFDQEIRPEALAFVDFSKEQIPDEQNAYFALMGHAAPLGDDPHQKGIEIINVHNRRVSEVRGYDPTIGDIRDKVLGPKKLVFQGKAMELCDRNSVRCLSAYREKARVIREMLRANRLLVERYYQLYRYPHFRETAKESAYVLVPFDDSATNALVRAAIGLQAHDGQIHEALKALQRDTRFWRLVFGECRTLIEKMIAIARVRRNVQLLSEIIASRSLNGKDINIAREILTPLSGSELDFQKVFRSEFAFTKNIIENTSDWGEQDDTWSESSPWYFLARPLFKTNATINLMYERHRDLAALAQLPPDRLMKQLVLEESKSDSGAQRINWHFVYNPMGKLLADMGRAPYIEYLGRTQNLGALIRLVTLQLFAKERGVSDSQMQSYLAQTEAGLMNPYTGEPARWDAQNRSLYFMCMREDWKGELMSKRIEVFTVD